MTDDRHCFHYVDADIPPGVTLAAYRRARAAGRPRRRGLRAALRLLLG